MAFRSNPRPGSGLNHACSPLPALLLRTEVQFCSIKGAVKPQGETHMQGTDLASQVSLDLPLLVCLFPWRSEEC